MGKELFEVFLGTFNAEPWIERLIDSLEAQDYPSFKVNILDNDSTDKTVAIVSRILSERTMKNEYKLFRNEKNIGPISSFMDRLDLFDCDWIFMVHQDDYYHPDHISTLASRLKEESPDVGVAFTAMQRIDEQGKVRLSPPTLSSKLSKSDRLENFILSLQISPVNFPACALNKTYLQKVDTSRHTTAFNDAELLMRMMCISDVLYIQKETMHYRIHSRNAASITSSRAADRATFVGLVELFYSTEAAEVLRLITSEIQWKQLTTAINRALEIRIKQKEIRDLLRNLIAESLIRKSGYKNQNLNDLLSFSLVELEMCAEAQIVKNLKSEVLVSRITPDQNMVLGLTHNQDQIISKSKSNLPPKLLHLFSLRFREATFNILFNSVFRWSKRPFVKVWRQRNR